MGRYFAFIFIFSLAFGLFFLRYTPEVVFVEGVVGQPTDLDPTTLPKNEIDEILNSLLFKALFKFDARGELVPDLAKSYKVAEGGRVYEIYLKEGIVWQDGRPIVAEDLRLALSQDPIFAETEIETLSERAIKFKLEKPLSSFLSLLTKPLVLSLGTEGEHSASLVGSGDFKVQRIKREEEIKEITLQNLGRGEIKKFVFKFFRTQAEAEEAAKRGEVDALVSESFTHPSFTRYTAPLYGRYFAIFFNLESKNKLIRDPTFRRAAARKTPTTELIDEILGGEGSPVRGPLSGTWAEGKLSFPSFSLALERGFRGKVVLTVPDIGKLPQVAEAVAKNWRELGVEITLASITPAQIEETLASKDFEAIILGQEVGRDPDRYSLWHSTQKDYPGLNTTSYSDPRADRALEEGRKTNQREERQQHYLNFQKLFLEDNPAIFLYHPNLSYFVSRRFSGIDLSPIFAPSERFWNIQEWKILR